MPFVDKRNRRADIKSLEWLVESKEFELQIQNDVIASQIEHMWRQRSLVQHKCDLIMMRQRSLVQQKCDLIKVVREHPADYLLNC